MTKHLLQFTLSLATLGSAVAQPAHDETRAFQLVNAITDSSYKQLVTLLRVVAEVAPEEQTNVNVSAPLTVSGSPEQLTAAAWIVKELDSSPAETASPRRFSTANGDVIDIFYLDPAMKPQDTQNVLVTLAQVADIRRFFSYTVRSAVVLKAPPAKAGIAEWLIPRLVAAASPTVEEYKTPDKTDDVTRVFHWNRSLTKSDVDQLCRNVRVEAHVTHMFDYRPNNALAVRGTAAQLSKVDWLVNVTEPTPQAPQR